jgi:hypothetical protein
MRAALPSPSSSTKSETLCGRAGGGVVQVTNKPAAGAAVGKPDALFHVMRTLRFLRLITTDLVRVIPLPFVFVACYVAGAVISLNFLLRCWLALRWREAAGLPQPTTPDTTSDHAQQS